MNKYVKIISVLLVITLVLSFAGCKKKQYEDKVVSQIVTDENGEAVTDSKGNAVTEIVTEEATSGADTSEASSAGNSGNTSATEAQKSTSKKADKTTQKETKTTQKKKPATKKTTEKQTTKKETTTKAPKKRDVTVEISLPFYNGQETDMIIYFKVKGDKKYTKLDPIKVKLDKVGKKENVVLKDIKGEVTVIMKFDGIDVLQNKVVIGPYEKSGNITPVTGIEILEGEDD